MGQHLRRRNRATLTGFVFAAAIAGQAFARPSGGAHLLSPPAGAQMQQSAQSQQPAKKRPPMPAPPRMKIHGTEGESKPPASRASRAAKPWYPVLYIEEEHVARGQGREHADIVRQIQGLGEQAHWEYDVIGLSPYAGPEDEVVFLSGFGSFAAIDQLGAKMRAASPDIVKSFNDLESQERAMHTSQRRMTAVFRPELSYQATRESVARARFLYYNQHIVEFGRNAAYESDMMFLRDAAAKAHVDRHWFVYEINAGAPNGTFVFLEPLAALAALDHDAENLQRMSAGLNARGKTHLRALWKDSVEQGTGAEESPVTRLFFIRRDMSRVSDDFASLDPSFWKIEK